MNSSPENPLPENPSPELNAPMAEVVPVKAKLVSLPPTPSVELVKPDDPVIEIQQLRHEQRKWKGRFIAVCVGFVFLLVVSVLQFIGTFITCQILFAARRDSEHAQRQTTDLLNKLTDARGSLNQAAKNLFDGRQSVGEMTKIEATLQRLDSQAARLTTTAEADAQRMALLADVVALRDDAVKHLRDSVEIMKTRLREADGLLAQMHGRKEEQGEGVLPFVDPHHKHPRACPVDQWPGVRGVTPLREPTVTHLEEQEHELALLIRLPDADTATVEQDSFTRDVLPIFQAKCARCHIDTRKGKLSLKSLADVLKGGQSGPAVVRGSLKESVLWEELSDRTMPPKGEPQLSAAEIDTIKRWIAGKE